jgi:hypothetical protein
MCPRERHLPLNLPLTLILFRQTNRHRDGPLKIGSIEGQRSPARSRSPSQSQRYCFKSFTQTCARNRRTGPFQPRRPRQDARQPRLPAARPRHQRRVPPPEPPTARYRGGSVAILRLNHATVTEAVTDSLTALAADPAASRRRRTARHIRPACASHLPQPPAPLATTPRTARSRPSGTRQLARHLSPDQASQRRPAAVTGGEARQLSRMCRR